MSDIEKAEAKLAKAIAKKDKTKYWVEGGTEASPTRTGPFYDPTKAKSRQKSDTRSWRNLSKFGKKPEMTIQTKPAVAGVTTPSHRVSPRTERMSPRSTLSGAKAPKRTIDV